MGSRLLGFQVVGLDPASGEPKVSYPILFIYLLLARTASLASTPQVEESILLVSFAGTAINKLLLYCQSCNFVARILVLQIIMHEIANING